MCQLDARERRVSHPIPVDEGRLGSLQEGWVDNGEAKDCALWTGQERPSRYPLGERPVELREGQSGYTGPDKISHDTAERVGLSS